MVSKSCLNHIAFRAVRQAVIQAHSQQNRTSSPEIQPSFSYCCDRWHGNLLAHLALASFQPRIRTGLSLVAAWTRQSSPSAIFDGATLEGRREEVQRFLARVHEGEGGVRDTLGGCLKGRGSWRPDDAEGDAKLVVTSVVPSA